MTARPAEAPLHLHLDPVGGIAGDMFLSAVLDAWPELEAPMIAGLRAAGLPERVRVAVMPAKDHALTGRGFAVTLDGPSAHSVPVVQLTGMVEASQLAASVKTRALALFGLIAEAEAAVHGIAVEAVALHELGAWDSVADLVGAAFLIDALGYSYRQVLCRTDKRHLCGAAEYPGSKCLSFVLRRSRLLCYR